MSHELDAEKGSLKLGERVHPAYYAQHQTEALNLNNTVYQEVLTMAAPSFRPKLRDILGVFQFSGDNINKLVGVLSGGEKARVSLAKILLSPGNFLIMDEPTNHLDLASKEALEQALREYDGTLLLISHDRYFLDKLVNRVFELKDGRITIYEGNYSDYLTRIETEAGRNAEVNVYPTNTKVCPDKSLSKSGPKSKEIKQKEAQARQRVSKERNRLQKIIEKLENEIEKLEAQKQNMENELADPQTYQNAERSRQLKNEYSQVEKSIQEKEENWEQAHLDLESILQEL